MSLVRASTLNELSTDANEEFFSKKYSAGDTVPYSGIYKCTSCKREVTVNSHSSDNTFPPHYQDPKFNCTKPVWQPYVIADTKVEF